MDVLQVEGNVGKSVIIVVMKIRKAGSRVKLGISCIIALVCVVGLGFSGYKIVEWLIDSNNTKVQTSAIEELGDVTEVDDDDNTEIIPQKDETHEGMYWQYLKTKLIDVDFTELKAQNSDTKGWIQVGGTNINYPFVQTTNNEYYLKHSFDKKYNNAGWVFADFRNKLDGTDRNLILYAHGRYDGTMFGTLRTALSNGWTSNSENFIMRTSSEHENALWQVFSAYLIPTTNDYIQTSFMNDAEFDAFVKKLMKRSAYNFHTTVSGTDHIITLSTCHNEDKRMVLHAKLIKRSVRSADTKEQEN